MGSPPVAGARAPRGERQPSLGAHLGRDGICRFELWAPRAERVEIELLEPDPRRLALEPAGDGLFCGAAAGIAAGALYLCRLDGGPGLPDPASRSQPAGVHGPSAVVDPSFDWEEDGWRGLDLARYVLYEIHVGTFTGEGTFAAIEPHLARLADLGVTAIELLPVAEFPGHRNWGYDGVFPFAVESSYGGPRALKHLVAACHRHRLAVVLDVVFNHLGPEGNPLESFGPFFTDRYRTPWGPALNFDGPGSDGVRRYFLEATVSWLEDFHLDGLRLDAVHAIDDLSEVSFLAELGEWTAAAARRRGRPAILFAESALNTLRFLRDRRHGGCGHHAQWCDDFHHALHALLTGERHGYYADFGRLEQVAAALRRGFVYTGQRSVYLGRRHGEPPVGCPPQRFVAFLQNHDQVGNRADGRRLAALVDLEVLKLAAGLLLTGPMIPLLFMGEEYGETAPFHFFVDPSGSVEAATIRRGRERELAAFGWSEVPPDPADPATYRACRLSPELRAHPQHAALESYYRELLRLRRELPGLGPPASGRRPRLTTDPRSGILSMERRSATGAVWIVCHFGDGTARFRPPHGGPWSLVLASASERWAGPGSLLPESFPGAHGQDRDEHEIGPWRLALYTAAARRRPGCAGPRGT